MGHFFPILVLAIIAIAKIMASAARQSGGDSSRPEVPRPAPTESERERRRRFMEAMGLPPESDLPSPVQPRRVANPAPLLPVTPPGARPASLRRVVSPSPVNVPPIVWHAPRSVPSLHVPPPATVVPPPAKIEPTPTTGAPSRTVVSQPAVTTPGPRISYPAKSLLLRLRNPDSVREAIILREVLGPPKALQLT